MQNTLPFLSAPQTQDLSGKPVQTAPGIKTHATADGEEQTFQDVLETADSVDVELAKNQQTNGEIHRHISENAVLGAPFHVSELSGKTQSNLEKSFDTTKNSTFDIVDVPPVSDGSPRNLKDALSGAIEAKTAISKQSDDVKASQPLTNDHTVAGKSALPNEAPGKAKSEVIVGPEEGAFIRASAENTSSATTLPNVTTNRSDIAQASNGTTNAKAEVTLPTLPQKDQPGQISGGSIDGTKEPHKQAHLAPIRDASFRTGAVPHSEGAQEVASFANPVPQSESQTQTQEARSFHGSSENALTDRKVSGDSETLAPRLSKDTISSNFDTKTKTPQPIASNTKSELDGAIGPDKTAQPVLGQNFSDMQTNTAASPVFSRKGEMPVIATEEKKGETSPQKTDNAASKPPSETAINTNQASVFSRTESKSESLFGALVSKEVSAKDLPNETPQTSGDAQPKTESAAPQPGSSVASTTFDSSTAMLLGTDTPQDTMASLTDPIESGEIGQIQGSQEARSLDTSSPLTQASKVDIPSRMAAQIAEAARVLPDKPVEITLSPEELGKVRLSFQVSENGAMQVVIAAERAETLDLLRRNIDTLVGEFKDMGLSDSTFSFAGFDQGFDGENAEAEQREDYRTSTTDEPMPAANPQEAVKLSLGSATGVDIRI